MRPCRESRDPPSFSAQSKHARSPRLEATVNCKAWRHMHPNDIGSEKEVVSAMLADVVLDLGMVY